MRIHNKLIRLCDLASRLIVPINSALEGQYTAASSNKNFVPIFILGAARSGTTLLYQLVSRSPDLAYINGFMTYFPRIPAITALLTRSQYKTRKILFNSKYGKSPGIMGPQQGHQIWGRWFRAGEITNELTLSQECSFQTAVNALQNIFGKPLAIKWPGFNAHLAELRHAFPDAFYIIIERNPFENAKSLYKGRVDLLGHPMKSITRLPRSYSYQGGVPEESIAEYLKSVSEDLAWLMGVLKEQQFAFIKYENLCEAPELTLTQIFKKYQEHSIFAVSLGEEIPARFLASPGPTLGSDIEARIQNYLHEIGIPEKLKFNYFIFMNT